jgi:hypothetical protein
VRVALGVSREGSGSGLKGGQTAEIPSAFFFCGSSSRNISLGGSIVSNGTHALVSVEVVQTSDA